MKNCKGVLINQRDNVLTVLELVHAGDMVCTGQETVKAVEEIPQYHKIARQNLQKGQVLYKYGQPMGFATTEILQGQWVHIHNADSKLPGGGTASC